MKRIAHESEEPWHEPLAERVADRVTQRSSHEDDQQHWGDLYGVALDERTAHQHGCLTGNDQTYEGCVLEQRQPAHDEEDDGRMELGDLVQPRPQVEPTHG